MTRRAVATIAAVALTLTACGGDDDEPAASDEPAAEEQPGDEPAEEEPAEEEPADGVGSDDDDAGGGDDGIVVRSVDDIPERCRDIMAAYFREVEPIVADVDWSAAGLDALEQVSTDIEDASTTFDDDVSAAGCDELEFVDGNDLELLIEFARDEAPGVVGYLEFLEGFGSGSPGGGVDSDPIDDALPEPGDGFADCGEAVTYMQELIDEYGTFTNVPPTEIMQIAGLSTVIQTCTPEQMEFFDSPEVTAFLEGG